MLGCVNSNFANSHGLHDEDHYTCPYDMALIARAAYQNETFMKINGTATYAMPATNKNEAKLLTNHHWFLNKTMKYDYCIGGKTGATTQAGYALVTSSFSVQSITCLTMMSSLHEISVLVVILLS